MMAIASWVTIELGLTPLLMLASKGIDRGICPPMKEAIASAATWLKCWPSAETALAQTIQVIS
jgi:hypothetical protein